MSTRIAVQETSVSRHHGDQLRALLKPPSLCITALSYWGFKDKTLNRSPNPLHRDTLVFLQQMCTQRNIFEILLNQPEIRLYIPFFDWFGSKRTSVWFQINGKMVYIIWFRVDLIRFRKYFSVCTFACCVGAVFSLYSTGKWNSRFCWF